MCFRASRIYQLSFIITHHSIKIQYSSLIYHFIHHITSTLILSHPFHLMCLIVSIVYQLFHYYSSFISMNILLSFYLSLHSLHYLSYNSITSLPSDVFNGLNSLSTLSLLLIIHFIIIVIILTSFIITFITFPFL